MDFYIFIFWQHPFIKREYIYAISIQVERSTAAYL